MPSIGGGARPYMPLYHRLESPTQTPADARRQAASGEMWGRTPRGGLKPTVQAFRGPLPPGCRGVEFETTIPPTKINPLSGEVRWRKGGAGVISKQSDGEEFAVIRCRVTKIVP